MLSNLHGKKVWLHSLGCRTNQSEKESIASGVAERGAIIADGPQNSDAAVIFTCSVTSTADKKSRQCIRMTRRNIPFGLIIACGCWAQRLNEDEAKGLGIDLVVGNRQKNLILGLLEKFFSPDETKHENEKKIFVTDVWGADNFWDALPLMRPVTRSRAFVKIQDGCDRFCSYCIVPYLRGRPVSRPFNDVIGEIRNVMENGCGEIVLTGTNLGGYICERGGLSALVDEISKMRVKLQFGSIEPFSIDDDFLNAVRKLSDESNFSPPLHIPLQSGDDGILARMKRGYNRDEYLAIIDRVRKILGEIPISTDLIVGFPGETENAFQNSINVLKEIGFCKVHVFPYSARENTLASNYKDRIPNETVSNRVKIISSFFAKSKVEK